MIEFFLILFLLTYPGCSFFACPFFGNRYIDALIFVEALAFEVDEDVGCVFCIFLFLKEALKFVVPGDYFELAAGEV